MIRRGDTLEGAAAAVIRAWNEAYQAGVRHLAAAQVAMISGDWKEGARLLRLHSEAVQARLSARRRYRELVGDKEVS